jgi:hypothetical protein
MASKVRGMKKVFVADVTTRTAPLTGFEVPTPGDEAIAGRSEEGYMGCFSQGREADGPPPRKRKIFGKESGAMKTVSPACVVTKV